MFILQSKFLSDHIQPGTYLSTFPLDHPLPKTTKTKQKQEIIK